MRLGRADGFLLASLIAGSKHVLLQLRPAMEKLVEVPCEPLPAVGNCHHRELDARLIMEAVFSSVAEVSERSGSTFYPSHIRYVSNDTGPGAISA